MGVVIEGLSKRFGTVTAVRSLSLDVQDGEFVTLLGASGCGKTTTLRCIAGLEEPTEGRILLDGEVVSDPAAGINLPPDRRDVGMVFQSYALWPHMSVFGNVAFPLAVKRVARATIESRVKAALELVGMGEFAERRSTQLSGGQQQRVALARAIVKEPRVLLFDEPLSNLDLQLRERMRSEIRALQRRLQLAAVFVTHDQGEALSLSDRVVVLENGTVVQEGTPGEIYRRPRSRFVAAFVGSANFIDIERVESRDGIITGTTLDGHPMQAAGDIVSSSCTVMVRPEHIRVTSALASEGRPGTNSLPGLLTEQLYLGTHYESYIETARTTLRTISSEPLSPGAVSVEFQAEHCSVIGRDNGSLETESEQ